MIRPGDISDAPAMGTVLSNWIAKTPWMPRLHTRDEDDAFCQRLIESTEVWVIDRTDGFGFLARHGASIDALYIEPDLQRRGWGGALLAAVQQDRDYLSLWTFQANIDAVAFYRAQNFQISNVTDGSGNAEKLPDYHMIWKRCA